MFNISNISLKHSGKDVYYTLSYNSYTLQNREEYLRYNNTWYKVEPIKWRLQKNDNQQNGYSTTEGAMAIMDTIVYADTYNSNKYTDLIGTTTKFNSTSDYIDLGREYMYTDKITVSISAYVDNWEDFNGYKKLISCTENGGWVFTSDSYLTTFAVGVYDEGYGYQMAVSDVEFSSLSAGWHTFAMTFDGDYARIYLDGELKATSGKFVSGKITYNATNSILVGAEPDYKDEPECFFEGLIKNVVIVNSVLSDIELKELANCAVRDINITDFLDDFAGYESIFGSSGIENIATNGKIFVSSIEEIKEIAGSYEVKFSDLVSDILTGIKAYYTRDLGTNYNNVKCITEMGSVVQRFATSLQGFQFTIKVKEYGCVS